MLLAKIGLVSSSVALGITAISLAFAAPASAATLTQIDERPEDSLGWKVEVRAGQAGTSGTYEGAIGPNGADADRFADFQWQWENGEAVDWMLNWDGSVATFDFGGKVIASDSLSPEGPFDGIGILTKAIATEGRVESGTTMDLIFQTVNGMDVEAFSSSTAGGVEFEEKFFLSDEPISTISGLATLTWDSLNPNLNNAQSRVAFKIEGFDSMPGETGPIGGGSDTAVPEPASILGLLAVGAVGAGSLKRRHAE